MCELHPAPPASFTHHHAWFARHPPDPVHLKPKFGGGRKIILHDESDPFLRHETLRR